MMSMSSIGIPGLIITIIALFGLVTLIRRLLRKKEA